MSESESLTKNASLGLDSPIARGGEKPNGEYYYQSQQLYKCNKCKRKCQRDSPGECYCGGVMTLIEGNHRRGFKFEKAHKPAPNHPKGTCRYCGKPLPPGQKKWCSKYGSCSRDYYYWHRDHKIYWKDVAGVALRRDNHKCTECGASAEDVHHIIPIYKGGDEFDIDNITSLCKSCHKRRHSVKSAEPEKGIHKPKLDEFATPSNRKGGVSERTNQSEQLTQVTLVKGGIE